MADLTSDFSAAVAALRSTTPGGVFAASRSAVAMSHRSSRSWGCSLGGEAYTSAAEQPRVICPLATQLKAAVNEPSGLAAKSADNRWASSPMTVGSLNTATLHDEAWQKLMRRLFTDTHLP